MHSFVPKPPGRCSGAPGDRPKVGLDGSGDEAVDHPRKAPAGRFLKIRKRQVTPEAARNRGLRTFRRRERSVRACGLGGRAAGLSSAGRCVPGRLGSDGLMRRNDGHAGGLSRGVRDNSRSRRRGCRCCTATAMTARWRFVETSRGTTARLATKADQRDEILPFNQLEQISIKFQSVAAPACEGLPRHRIEPKLP